jgi:hypothetical protein
MKTDKVRWTVASPDGVPIAPETYPSEDAAQKALAAWCGRYEAQGYYASVSGRIALADLPGRCRVESDETPDAKFTRIAQEIKSNADWRALLAGTYDDELTALDEIAKHYGGENTHTGGNIYVVLIALGLHDVMAISAETLCRYHSEMLTNPYEIFWEPENYISESATEVRARDAQRYAMRTGF